MRVLAINLIILVVLLSVLEGSFSALLMFQDGRLSSTEAVVRKMNILRQKKAAGQMSFDARCSTMSSWQPASPLTSHPKYGWWGKPSVESNLTIERQNGASYTWKYSTTPWGSRITKRFSDYNSPSNKENPSPKIIILGDSQLNGWAVNDTASMSFKIQTLLPDYEVINLSGSGFGTVQAFLILEDIKNGTFKENLLTKDKRLPEGSIVLLGFGPYYRARNTFNKPWITTLRSFAECRPFFKSSNGIEFKYPDIRLLDNGDISVSIFDLFSHHSFHDTSIAENSMISMKLHEKIFDITEELGADLAVMLLLGKDIPEVEFLRSKGARIIDARQKRLIHQYDTLLPFDQHHGYLSHDTFANEFVDSLQKYINSTKSK
jgi:hypothetical protein